MQDPWAARFPELFRPRFETYAGADLAFRVGAPLDELVARIHVIALDEQGHVAVCRSVEGWRFLPGAAAAWLAEWEEESEHGRVVRLAIAMGLLTP